MIDHFGIHVSDYDAAKRFYDAAFAALGGSLVMTVPPEFTGGKRSGGYGRGKPYFWMTEGAAQTPSTHIAFAADDRAQVDAFYKAAMAAGGRDNGAPGIREHYHPNYYGAFVLDPDGNNIEAVCHKPE
ncbi:MAG: glyoxalase/bleomycin resistance/extradiol dioxygenase family protein [Rhizobiales bacterium]|nr:glyoxalase/bleomycin resistance/extradiol dioxygenase family protein [Hyphomicrobiales bacterium]MBA70662.1 glyoxalase/bleomycin resistance/extradiol dioxygenase family protein [Hyphomicrobiales bacterium]|tara:strand:- start:83 stop:466 length:384 start_codon:yes stop_codon:yes gene_type:complete